MELPEVAAAGGAPPVHRLLFVDAGQLRGHGDGKANFVSHHLFSVWHRLVHSPAPPPRLVCSSLCGLVQKVACHHLTTPLQCRLSMTSPSRLSCNPLPLCGDVRLPAATSVEEFPEGERGRRETVELWSRKTPKRMTIAQREGPLRPCLQSHS